VTNPNDPHQQGATPGGGQPYGQQPPQDAPQPSYGAPQPSYGAPQAGGGQYVQPPAQQSYGAPTPGGHGAGGQKPQNTFGLVALILGIVSIVLCCLYAGVWAGIPAIVLGYLGMNKAKQGLATNRGMAMAGLICGVVGLLLTIALIALTAAGTVNYGDYTP